LIGHASRPLAFGLNYRFHPRPNSHRIKTDKAVTMTPTSDTWAPRVPDQKEGAPSND
jgi:hypothetical protein